MKIRINKLRIFIFLLLLSAVLVLSGFAGGPVIYVPLYMLLLLIPVLALYILINYMTLKIYQEVDVHRLTKGEAHGYTAMIENSGFLPVRKLSLRLYKDRSYFDSISDGEELSLDIREKKKLSSVICCSFVGTYYVGIERVGFTAPFDLFSVEFNNPNSFKAIVAPRITDMADRALDIENTVNSTGLKSERLLEEIYGNDLRGYMKGDPLSSVNWKVSARLGELCVRLPDKLENRTVTIILEAAYLTENDQDIEVLRKRDRFLEFAVSAAWHFASQNVPVSLIYPNGKVTHSVVDSYESFMEFYLLAADKIYYRAEDEAEKLKKLADEWRCGLHEGDTGIIITEDPADGEDELTVCG